MSDTRHESVNLLIGLVGELFIHCVCLILCIYVLVCLGLCLFVDGNVHNWDHLTEIYIACKMPNTNQIVSNIYGILFICDHLLKTLIPDKRGISQGRKSIASYEASRYGG